MRIKPHKSHARMHAHTKATLSATDYREWMFKLTKKTWCREADQKVIVHPSTICLQPIGEIDQHLPKTANPKNTIRSILMNGVMPVQNYQMYMGETCWSLGSGSKSLPTRGPCHGNKGHNITGRDAMGDTTFLRSAWDYCNPTNMVT